MAISGSFRLVVTCDRDIKFHDRKYRTKRRSCTFTAADITLAVQKAKQAGWVIELPNNVKCPDCARSTDYTPATLMDFATWCRDNLDEEASNQVQPHVADFVDYWQKTKG